MKIPPLLEKSVFLTLSLKRIPTPSKPKNSGMIFFAASMKSAYDRYVLIKLAVAIV